MSTFFLFLFHFFKRHRLIYWILLISISCLSVFFALKIKLQEDISKFIPHDGGIDKTTYVFQNFKFKDKLFVNIFLSDSTKCDPEKLKLFADELAANLKNDYQPEYIREIFYEIDDEIEKNTFLSFYNQLPFFLDEKDYGYFDSIQEKTFIENKIRSNYKLLLSPAGFALKDYLLRDPLGFSKLALNKIKSIDIDENYEIYNGNIFTRDKKNLLLYITSSNPSNETSENAKLVKGLDKVISQLTQKYQHQIKAEYFGGIAVGVANANRSKLDSLITSAVAIVLLILLLFFFFRKKRVIGLILLPVLFGTVLSLAVIFLLKGTISTLALGAGSVILGIAVNYSLHFFTHLKHTGSPEEVIKDLSDPLIIGGATTIGAFISLLFVKSEALNDFGLFSAFSLMGAALFSIIFLPHLISAKAFHKVKNKSGNTFLEKISAYRLENNRYVIISLFVILVICFFKAWDVKFESDMMSVNYYPEKIAAAEKNLNKISDHKYKTIYLISTGNNLDEALNNSNKLTAGLNKLKNEGRIKKHTSISSLISSDSVLQIKIKRWKLYWTDERKLQLQNNMIQAGEKFKFKESAFEKFYEFLHKNFRIPVNDTYDSLNNMLLDNWITSTPELTMVATVVKVDNKDKDILISEFSSRPNLVILDKQFLTATFAEIIKDDFNLILLITSLLVFGFLLISYGRIELAIITFIPMLLSWVLILGMMSIFGLKFNIINIIISTFIFGLGDDYSIFIMDGLLVNYKTGKKILNSYKTSVYLSALTTIIGIGVLIFAKHPALKSIALVTIIGMVSVVLIANTVVPFLFKWLIQNRKKIRSQPVTFFIFFYSLVCYTLYLTGCVIIVIFGFIIKIFPFRKRKQQYLYHLLIMALSHFIIFIMFITKKHIIDKNKVNFKKPHFIICNHQSIIDIPLVLTFTPKLIVLTNDWVWNSPVIGKLVRMADFYPISAGIEKLIPLLEKKVNEGYSVLIFPEGTRSENRKIKRFHKGAFYLAEKLKLDILPVLINGTADYVAKGELFGKKSTITVKFLEPLPLSDNNFGTNYSEKARHIRAFFRNEFEKLLSEHYQNPDYYKNKLIKNYIYKGPILEWYLKLKLRFENNYTFYHQHIPADAKIVDIGCGFGFLSYMLSFLSENRKITGIDYDENKILIANNCRDKNDKLSFVFVNALDYDFSQSDAFVLSDVLHYIPEENQQQLIVKCIKSLNPNGVIIIRDADNELKSRHWGTRITEFFSTKFGFNKTMDTTKQLYFISRSKINGIIKDFDNITMEVVDNSTLTSNVFYFIKRTA